MAQACLSKMSGASNSCSGSKYILPSWPHLTINNTISAPSGNIPHLDGIRSRAPSLDLVLLHTYLWRVPHLPLYLLWHDRGSFGLVHRRFLQFSLRMQARA